MATTWRHYRLYMWKNAIQKKRQWGSACCEIIAPLVVVGMLVALNQNNRVNSDTFECGLQSTRGAKYDFAYLPRALNLTNRRLALIGPASSAFEHHLEDYYPGLDTDIAESLQCSNYLYSSIIPTGKNNEPAVPKWSGKTDYVMRFESEDTMLSYINAKEYGMDVDHPALYAAIVFEKGDISDSIPDTNHDVSIQNGWRYKIRMNLTDVPDTHIFTNDLRRDIFMKSQRLYLAPPAWDSYDDSKTNISLAMPGFVQIQMAVDKFILQQKLGTPVLKPSCPANSTVDIPQSLQAELTEFAYAWGCNVTKVLESCEVIANGLLKSTQLPPQAVGVAQFPISEFSQNRVYQYTQNVFAMLFVISFLFPSFRLIRAIVDEKETKIREGMKMMGMSEFALFSAWFTTYMIIFAIIAILIVALTSWNVFGHTDGFLLFLMFWLFGCASTALCFLISVFFSRAKVAAVVGTVLFIASFFPYYTVNGEYEPFLSKSWASLCVPVAFGLNLDILATTESNGVGIQWNNLYRHYNNYTFGHGLLMMVIDFCLYTFLGWYLDQVVPSEFGVRRPWYFLFTRAYWTGKASGAHATDTQPTCSWKSIMNRFRKGRLSPRHGRRASQGKHLLEDTERGAAIDPGYAPKIEPVGQHLRALDDANRVVRIKGLRKQFETPDGVKVAVQNLDLTMYEGQIFALLGHNGAGKTTTISMLSGLIPPSGGNASILGLDIRTDMAEIRKTMGVCPQHDVLWPDLTCKEHLEYFAGIKGVPAKEVKKAVNEMIVEVGLTEKSNVLSKELSGGQKRKLSVGIALIGGSKVIFCDEPTSGMDPYSRRSTWNILQNARKGRVMILTTHFMDEADLLGDRIGIMAEGRVQCCGSSMFLKQQYGVGYNLTIVKQKGCDSHSVERAVAEYIPQKEYEILSDVGTEMAFQLPMHASKIFPQMLKHLEDERGTLRISNYGIGVTTLEEVFLRVAESAAEAVAADREAQEQQEFDDDNAMGMDGRTSSSLANVLSSFGKTFGRVAGITGSASQNNGQGVSLMMTDLSSKSNESPRKDDEFHDDLLLGSYAPPDTLYGHSGSSSIAVDTSQVSNSASSKRYEPFSPVVHEPSPNHSIQHGSSSNAAFGANHDMMHDEEHDDLAKAAETWQPPQNMFTTHFRALFMKRFHAAKRDKKALCFQLFIPVLALLGGLLLLKLNPPKNPPAIVIDPTSLNPSFSRPSFAPVPSNWQLSSSEQGILQNSIIEVDDARTLRGKYLSATPTPNPVDGWNTIPYNDSLAAQSLSDVILSAYGEPYAVKHLENQYNPPQYNTSFNSLLTDLAYLVAHPDNQTALNDITNQISSVFGDDKKSAASDLACYVARPEWGAPPMLLQTYLQPNTLVGSVIPPSKTLIPGLANTSIGDLNRLSQWLLQQVNQTKASRYGAFVTPMFEFDSNTGAHNRLNVTAIILSNSTAYHAVPLFVNMITSSLYRHVHQSDAKAASAKQTIVENMGSLDQNDASRDALNSIVNDAEPVGITVVNDPFPYTNAQQGAIQSITSFVTVMFIVIAFAFIPASFAVFIVKEREVNAKHQQLISGVSIPAYWCSSFVWDIVNYMPPFIISVIMVRAFNIEDLVVDGAIWATVILFFLYGVSVAAFTYCLSYVFKSHSTAQTIVLVLNLCCLVLLLASFIMYQIESTCKIDRALRFVYRLIPSYALGNGLLQLSIMKGLVYLDNDCGDLTAQEQFSREFGPFSWQIAGWPILYMAIEAVVYFLLAIAIDIFLSFPALRKRIMHDKDKEDAPYQVDEDVQEEADRIARGDAKDETIVLQNLRKVYNGAKVAVRNLSFAIPGGQVFGFLGINGAGKTTTLKMLSGDILPTKGTAKLDSMDILREQIECRRRLGYCPQFDALLELLTVREHLELFARIKGVPEYLLERIVQNQMREMNISQFEHRCAGTLSGGNKRKLSVAIAMIGVRPPRLIFLDEPSTGMDPMARRFMWNVISRIANKNKQSAIILTTHSMEECEALCSRVGIMVGGRLRCLGSIQHLKNRFGKGYLVEVKLNTATDEMIQRVKDEVEIYFENARQKRSASSNEASLSCITLQNLDELCEFLGDTIRRRMIHPNGSGWAISGQLSTEGKADKTTFAEWWAFETAAARLNQFMTSSFPKSNLVERHGDLFRYKLPETSQALSAMFGLIEKNKQDLHISTYALSQTTLEQIFNVFASQQEEEVGAVRGMIREEENPVDEDIPPAAASASAHGEYRLLSSDRAIE